MEQQFSRTLLHVMEWVIHLFEVILSLFLIVGVAAAGVMMVFRLQGVFNHGTGQDFQLFLDDALLYIIGLEVAMMLIKRDPRLVIDILIFAISRKMIMTMQTGADFLFGSMAILILYLVKSFGINGPSLVQSIRRVFTPHDHPLDLSSDESHRSNADADEPH